MLARFWVVTVKPSRLEVTSSRWAPQLGTGSSSKVRSDTAKVFARLTRLGSATVGRRCNRRSPDSCNPGYCRTGPSCPNQCGDLAPFAVADVGHHVSRLLEGDRGTRGEFSRVAPSQRFCCTHQGPRTLSKLWFS